jgi:hypothetical protein
MRGGFAKGMVFGGIVGAVMSMVMNNDIDVNRTKRRIMRIGKSILKRKRKLVASLAGMMR